MTLRLEKSSTSWSAQSPQYDPPMDDHLSADCRLGASNLNRETSVLSGLRSAIAILAGGSVLAWGAILTFQRLRRRANRPNTPRQGSTKAMLAGSGIVCLEISPAILNVAVT